MPSTHTDHGINVLLLLLSFLETRTRHAMSLTWKGSLRPLLCLVCLFTILVDRVAASGGSSDAAVGTGPNSINHSPANLGEGSSRNFLGDIIGTLTSGVKEFGGACIWGYNCGGGCAPYEKYGTKRYKDALDKACLVHDICLCTARSADQRKSCDKSLLLASKQVWKKEDKCPAWNIMCTNSAVAAAARDVHNAMAVFGSGKTINCKCKLHPCSTSSQGSGDDYDYDYDYRRK